MADLVMEIPAFAQRWTRRRPAPAMAFYTLVGNFPGETNSMHALVLFIFPILLGFLQLKYPQNPTSFQVHPNTIFVSIASILVYCLAFVGRLMFATIWVPHFDTLMKVFGSLSLVSLVLMLLPDSWRSIGFILYLVWFVFHVLAMIRTHFNVMQPQPQQMRRERPLLPITLMDLN